MSKQLAISSTFAVFAMVCMVLSVTGDRSGLSTGDMLVPVQAELPSLDLPTPDLLP